MKNVKFILIAVFLAAFMFSCSDKGTSPEPNNGDGKIDGGKVSGTFKKDITFKSDIEYSLDGMVYFEEGTLTIEAGTQIKSQGKSALIIMPGAKIEAVGTKAKPIVFTSSAATPNPGDWAGVVIFGNAPVSTADHTQGFEANPEDIFGGDNAADNSGTFKYVRIEYAGWLVATDKELNGLTLGGVGTGTTIEYVQIHGAEDDAVEWFGGRASVNHMVVTDYNDDGFDIDEGYQGSNEYLLNIQGSGSDRGIEAGHKAADDQLITNAGFSYMTLISNSINQAVHIKDNVTLRISKSVFIGKNTPQLMKVEGAVSLEQVTSEKTKCTDCFYDGVFDTLVDASDAAAQALLEPMFTMASLSLNADYSPKNAAIKAAGAGAITGTELWYDGWTAHIPDYSEQVIEADFCDGKGTKITDALIVSDITENTCLVSGTEYEISGMIYVTDGAVLTIEEGTTFKSEGKSALIVMPGAKIIAEGTKEAPIVFTSKAAAPKTGDWAGVVLFGNAPVSTADHTQGFEAEPADIFGGDIADDNSGVLKYVRIEYAGWLVATDKELNGLTLGGVGSKTVIDYVQIHAGKDDAIEWFGGRAGITHAVVTDYNDDGYDIDEGYQGSNQWLLNIQGAGSDRGIEAGSKAADASMITEASFSNITIVANSTNEAILVKDNVALMVDKIVVIGDNTSALVKVEGAVSLEKVTSQATAFTNAFYEGSFTVIADASGDAGAQALLDPMFTRTEGALNDDYTPAAQAVIDAQAGAIVGDDLWYEGWTANMSSFPGPGDFCNGKGAKITASLLDNDITENTCLVNDVTYEFSGLVYVQSPAVLTIQAGTNFMSEGKSALIVMPGAKVIASGTKSAPIVFTSKSAAPAAGDWAGVVLFGNAPVSTADHTQGFEANPADIFGGDIADDSSGVFKYVRIEYAGWLVATDKELNGLTLGGVGSGTTIDYVQVHAGKDDAIEWFGGRAGISHVVVTDYNDDGYDIDEGYQGSNQYLLNIQGPGSDRGIEAGSKAADASMITEASFSNITIVANSTNQAILIKDNVALMVDKMVVVGDSTPALVAVEGAVSFEQVTNSATSFASSFYDGVFTAIVDAAGSPAAQIILDGMFTEAAGALNADFTPAAQTVIDAEAGAVVGTDTWFKGWTKSGTIVMP